MGFLSYNLNYYRNELQKLETAPPTQNNLYHACRLLRMLDDLAGEGYTELNHLLEKECRGMSRLREYLCANSIKPFPDIRNQSNTGNLHYSPQDTELSQAISQMVSEAKKLTGKTAFPFAGRLRDFCRWIGYENNTAYVFLLRDTLLPFIYFLEGGRKRIFPWLLSRSSFAALAGRQNVDDELRASVYKALESSCTDYQTFLESVLPDMRKIFKAYPRAENALRGLLEKIDAKKILIIESGCAGTFPLLLMSLNERADMRIYTTYPYLSGIFGERIFTSRYEESRIFETLASQDQYFRFSDIRDGLFYVRKCTDMTVEQQALSEIKMMTKKIMNGGFLGTRVP